MSIWDQTMRSWPDLQDVAGDVPQALDQTPPESGTIVFDLAPAFEERLEPVLDEIRRERARSNQLLLVPPAVQRSLEEGD